jgi:hypothetical protein
MAWQYPTHSCGHAGMPYQAYGPMENRNHKLRSVESNPCPKCQAITAGEQSKADGLQLLNGSPVDRKIKASDLLVEAREEFRKRREYTDARWWIENRNIATPLDFVVARRDAEKRKLGL